MVADWTSGGKRREEGRERDRNADGGSGGESCGEQRGLQLFLLLSHGLTNAAAATPIAPGARAGMRRLVERGECVQHGERHGFILATLHPGRGDGRGIGLLRRRRCRGLPAPPLVQVVRHSLRKYEQCTAQHSVRPSVAVSFRLRDEWRNGSSSAALTARPSAAHTLFPSRRPHTPSTAREQPPRPSMEAAACSLSASQSSSRCWL